MIMRNKKRNGNGGVRSELNNIITQKRAIAARKSYLRYEHSQQ
jgi:hypothetical protein